MSQILEITLENFDSMVMAASKERPVVLNFFSSRYPECATYAALLEKQASILDFTLGTVNLDVPENSQFIQVLPVAFSYFYFMLNKGENSCAQKSV